jgi:hypothetical protein
VKLLRLIGLFAFFLCTATLEPASSVIQTTGQLSIPDVMALASAAGFECTGRARNQELLNAVAIAVSESSLRPDAAKLRPELGRRPDGTVHMDRGLWQISSYWWPQYSDEETFNPVAAASIAFELSDGGRRFSAWDSYARGDAQRHFDEAYDGWPALRPLVNGFCSTHAAVNHP